MRVRLVPCRFPRLLIDAVDDLRAWDACELRFGRLVDLKYGDLPAAIYRAAAVALRAAGRDFWPPALRGGAPRSRRRRAAVRTVTT